MSSKHAKETTATDTVAVTEWLEQRKIIAQIVQAAALRTRDSLAQ